MDLKMEQTGLSFRIKPVQVIVFLSVINLWLFALWFSGREDLQGHTGEMGRVERLIIKAWNNIIPGFYWEEAADTILSDLFSVSEQTLEAKKKRFLEDSGCPDDLKVIFEEISAWINKGGVTTAFYPKTFSLDRSKKQLRVTGIFLVNDARFQEPVEFKRTYDLGWSFHGGEGILLTSIKEVREEDEENETK